MPNKKISFEQLVEYQTIARHVEEITGSLTVAAFATWAGYRSKSAALYAMQRMVEAGLIVTHPRGEHGTTYRVAEVTK